MNKRNSVDISEIPESKSNAENVSDWFDYEAQKSTKYPPAGTECYLSMSGKLKKVFVIGFDNLGHICVLLDGGPQLLGGFKSSFKPITYEAEKKRVIDAAVSLPAFQRDEALDFVEFIAGHLFDAGFLRMPAE